MERGQGTQEGKGNRSNEDGGGGEAGLMESEMGQEKGTKESGMAGKLSGAELAELSELAELAELAELVYRTKTRVGARWRE
jgi:hypothetical protein